jgi:hypothetical protein
MISLFGIVVLQPYVRDHHGLIVSFWNSKIYQHLMKFVLSLTLDMYAAYFFTRLHVLIEKINSVVLCRSCCYIR